jgi:hypothetical protein
MSDQHLRFLDRLRGSSPGVFAFGYWLHRKGYTIEIPGLKFAPTANDAIHYVDSGDLFIVKPRERYDVKHLSRTFSSGQDFPFPDAFVANVPAVDRADDVALYVSISNDLKCAALIPPITKPEWRIKETRASNTGNVERFYACPLRYVTFEALQ